MTARPRRSALYMPASNVKAIAKARTLPCDVVILDLEDAIAPDMKDAARQGLQGRAMRFSRTGVTRANVLRVEAAASCLPLVEELGETAHLRAG
jgi:citrate lyase beta subunit